MRQYLLAAALFLAAVFPFVVVDSAPGQDFAVVLAAADRPDTERALDPVRKPAEVLKFYGVKPGDKVADLMAGRGYYTIVLARTVGSNGAVYSVSATLRKELAERLKNPDYAHVQAIESKMDAVELPAAALDFVLIHLNYHDLTPEVRIGMNKRVYAALKPGGVYGVVDHAAKDGTTNEAAKPLHRIDKAAVVNEVTAAGFVLAAEGDMLKNPNDPRTESVFVDRGKSERFVLRFEKRQ